MKKACEAMATFAACLQTADQNWTDGKVPSNVYESTRKLIESNGGTDVVMMMLAMLITKPEETEDEYPTINFLNNGE